MFAFTVFWAYVTFSQYFLIWNANLPEETFWYNLREINTNGVFNQWGWVGMVLIFGHFLAPFLFLIFYKNKITHSRIGPASVWILAIILVDSNGNENPLAATPLRDRMLPAASQVLVSPAGSVAYVVHYYFDNVENVGMMHTGFVTMPGAFVNHGTDFPNKVTLGYKLGSTNPAMPAYIDPSNTVIRVYYVLDPDQKADIKVEYYFDGVHNATYDATITPQILSTVTQSQVVLSSPPSGYVLDTPPTDPVLPASAVSLDGTTVKVYYTYTYQEFSISKMVTGEYADRTKLFSFTAYFQDKTGTPLPAGTTFTYRGESGDSSAPTPASGTFTLGSSGEATFQLMHYQSIVVEDVKSIEKIRIVETPDANYNTMYEDSNDAGTYISSNDTTVKDMTNDDRNFTFYNERKTVVPSGLTLDEDTSYALLVMVLVFSSILLIGFRPKANRGMRGLI
jgi:hypothetical protein